MKPLTDYLRKNYEKSVIEQIADEYRDKGYSIKKEAKVGPYRIDIVATKDDKTIYLEVKTDVESSKSKQRIKDLAEYVKNIPNAKFVVAVSRFPEPKIIEFDGIETVLHNYFVYHLPSDLDVLSSHTRFANVYSVTITEVKIQDGCFIISCNGKIKVTLQYGSDLENEAVDEPLVMTFPFNFKGTVNYNDGYRVTDCEELKIDTDAFYE